MKIDYTEVCIHEASHLVFSRLISKLGIEFPETEYVEIMKEGNGAIVSGWYSEFGTPVAEKQIDVLKGKSDIIIIAQLMFSISGYVSYQSFVNENIDKCELENFVIGEMASDIEKCNKLASLLSKEGKVRKINGDWLINEPNLRILNEIKKIVLDYMNEKPIRSSIKFAAKELCQKIGEEIKNEELDLLFIEIDKLLDDLNFNILKIKLQKCEETIKNG